MAKISKIEINGEEFNLGSSGGLAFSGTMAEYEIAKLIPSDQDGYIPPGSLVRITDVNSSVYGKEVEVNNG